MNQAPILLNESILKVTVIMMNMDTINNIKNMKLGVTYSKDRSVFSLWAPTASSVFLVLYEDAGTYDERGFVTNHDGGYEIQMNREDDGLWRITVTENTNNKYYMYKIEHEAGEYRYAIDPYATAVSVNGCRGAIVDPEACNPQDWDRDERPPFIQPTDAVLYELHVRDFSISSDSGMKYKGKYKAFTETGLKDENGNSLGIDHLAELGVTHVHLLPIFDFKTVNEMDNEQAYNWGYDPQNYNVPEGSYATDPTKPEIRILECKEMIHALHKKGIRVIMDVVYNHTYTVDDGPFEPVVPGYFYRRNGNGELSNGSGVGNELATEKSMVRKFIKDSLRYWAEEYHIDGFRFDLMALMDTTTIYEIVDELRSEVDPKILIYGEPWTGGDSPLHNKTVKGTQRGKGFAVFNDHFRHAIKGDNDGGGKGFATGEIWCEGAIAEGMMGSIHDFAEHASETVNYVTVHDNLNLWDKVLTSLGMGQQAGLMHLNNGSPVSGGDLLEELSNCQPYFAVSEDEVMESEPVRRSLLANGIVLLSQGIPLIHAGDELLRSKYGDHNSYRSGDAINGIRWENKGRFLPVFQYYKGLLQLRRLHPAFRMNNRAQIEEHMEIIRCGDQLIAYRLNNHANEDVWSDIVVIVNGSYHESIMDLPASPYGWNVVVNDRMAGIETLMIVDTSEINVPGLSIMVLRADKQRPKRNVVKIELEYEREDQNYDGWNLWVWGTGIKDGQIDFTQKEDGRVTAVIYTEADMKRIGCIVRLNEWEAREWEQDRFIILPPGEKQLKIKVISGSGEWRSHSDMAS
ncbi:type I pullulanase [Paenibacillus sp. GCM10028914]|uniref:type I pullulanase n=1 Tax=Paenibacillus sp. GCM10028914 TaxID=3273416 RepID=UPI00361052BD